MNRSTLSRYRYAIIAGTGLLLFAMWYFGSPSRIPFFTHNDEVLWEPRWDNNPHSKKTSYQYEYEWAKGGKSYTTTCYYQLPDDDAELIRFKRITCPKGDPTNITEEYFAMRPLYASDAQALHKLVEESGKDHFADQPTYKYYGGSIENAVTHIGQQVDQWTVWFSQDNKLNFQCVGNIGLNQLEMDKKLTSDKDKGVFTAFYFMGAPEVTKVQGVTVAALFGVMSHACLKTEGDVDTVQLDIFKDNKRSQKVAERLGFTKSDKFTNKNSYVGVNKELTQRDMYHYFMRREEISLKIKNLRHSQSED